MVRILSVLVVVSAALMGCSGGESRIESITPAKAPKWDGLDKLDAALYPLQMSADRNDWSGVKAAIGKPEFQSALDAFANSTIPKEFATDARKQAKEEVVTNFRGAANAGGAKDIQTAYQSALASLAKVRRPAGGESSKAK